MRIAKPFTSLLAWRHGGSTRVHLIAVAVVAVIGSLLVAQPAHAAVVNCTLAAPKEIRYGDTGSCVLLLQEQLGGLARDGQFGPLTYAAVRAFQTANGLQVDGIAGPRTWAKIKAGFPAWGTVLAAFREVTFGGNLYACRSPNNARMVKYAFKNLYFRSTIFVASNPQVYPDYYVLILPESIYDQIDYGEIVQSAYRNAVPAGQKQSFTEFTFGSDGWVEEINQTVSFFPSLLRYCP